MHDLRVLYLARSGVFANFAKLKVKGLNLEKLLKIDFIT